MYNYIESKYKKNSSNRNFFVLYYSIAIILYTGFVILGLFNFNNVLLSMFILLTIFIFIIYIIVFIKLGYKFKDWRLFFKFKDNKELFKQKLDKEDRNIIKNILIDLNITRRSDIKLIIEYYRLLSLTAKKKYNYINIISTIIAIFLSFKDILLNNGEQLIECFSFLVIILLSFSVLYFCFVQIMDLKDIISGDKNLYHNLEELLTKEYIDRN